VRRLLAILLPLVAVAAVQPAGAAPVASSRAAVVRVTLPADDGAQLRVELRAIARATGGYLAVSVTFCDSSCEAPRYYAGALPKGSLSIAADSAKAHLEAVIGGLPFEITWRPAERPGAVVGSLHGGGSGEDNTFAAYSGDPATAAVMISTHGCATDATVGDEHEISTSATGNDVYAPLARLRLRTTRAPGCTA
jgi:hypothetical protein